MRSNGMIEVGCYAKEPKLAAPEDFEQAAGELLDKEPKERITA